jgi:2,5-diketo-D-gluconate reductase A
MSDSKHMEMPEVGLGTYRLYDKTYDSVTNALNAGYRHFDTAPLYKCEDKVGEAISDSIRRGEIDRSDIFITTKVSRKELNKIEVAESIDRSIETIGTKYLDLVILHEPIKHRENWDALVAYQKAHPGKVRSIGVSNYKVDHLIDVIDSGFTPAVNQIEVNPFLARDDIVEFCKKAGITVVAHTPLAKAEKLNDDSLVAMAERLGVSSATLMLRFGMRNGYKIIPRSSDVDHIIENYNTSVEIGEKDMSILRGFDCRYATHPKYL